MKFLISRAESHAESEEIWGLLRESLFDIGLPTTRRRIQALALGRDGEWTFLEVDMATPAGDPVLAIFEASNADLFYVCTPHQVVEAPPMRSALRRGRRWWILMRGWWGVVEAGAALSSEGRGATRSSARSRRSPRRDAGGGNGLTRLADSNRRSNGGIAASDLLLPQKTGIQGTSWNIDNLPRKRYLAVVINLGGDR